MVRALVTGGAGFIGSTLVDRLLAEGHAVDVVDDLSTGVLGNLADARADRSHDLHVHQLDVCTPEVVDLVVRRRPDVVFHLAAQRDPSVGLERPTFDAEVNVLGTLHVLEGARRAGARKVVAALAADVYGDPDPGDLPVREAHPHAPLHPTGVAGVAVWHYLRAYRARHGLDSTALVLADVYGPRQLTGVVATFARRIRAAEACVIRGDGARTRDFVYVDDVVDALVRAAERGSGLLCNVGTGVQTSIRDLHAVVAEQAGAPDAPVEHGPAVPGEPRRRALAVGRASIHLGWKPWTPLPTGVAEVLDWQAATRP